MRTLLILLLIPVITVAAQDPARSPWAHLRASNYTEKDGILSNRVGHGTPTPGESIATKETYSGPLQIKATVRLPEGQGDLRIFAYRTALLILCPTHSEGIGVHIRRPGAERLYAGSPLNVGPTPVSFKDWATVVWRITEQGMALYIDGQLMLVEYRPLPLHPSSPVSICGCMTTLDVKAFDVTRLSAGEELLLPAVKKPGPWSHLHPANYVVVEDFIRNSFSTPGPTPPPTLAVGTCESYAGPIEINAVVRLTQESGADIRLFAFRSGVLIFNPHLINAPDKLLSIAFRLPDAQEAYTGTEVKPAPCPSDFKDWTKVTWRITERGMTVLVNDKQFYHVNKRFDLSVGGPVRVGGYSGPIDIKSLEVKSLSGDSKTPSPRTVAGRVPKETPKKEVARKPEMSEEEVAGKDAPEKPKGDEGFFYEVPDARDCAFDHARQRLYVTTPQKLVIIDTKERKMLEPVELGGSLQACDITPDGKSLVIGPAQGHFLYRIGLDWKTLAKMDIAQVRFKAGGVEPGVYALAAGSDNSVIFTMTYAGSGVVKLRRMNANNAVDEIGSVVMDSMVSASGDRNFAAVAEGASSNGPLKLYDFHKHQLRHVADLNWYIYEIACSRGARYFARPHQTGCDLLDSQGTRLGNLEGKTVICAAFHPKRNALFVMRAGEMAIQEYDMNARLVAAPYTLDRPLVIKGDTVVTNVANLHAVGRDTVIANFSSKRSVHYKGFRSGRLRVSDDGAHLFAVIPAGVYDFTVKAPPPVAAGDETAKPKIRVVKPPGK